MKNHWKSYVHLKLISKELSHFKKLKSKKINKMTIISSTWKQFKMKMLVDYAKYFMKKKVNGIMVSSVELTVMTKRLMFKSSDTKML